MFSPWNDTSGMPLLPDAILTNDAVEVGDATLLDHAGNDTLGEALVQIDDANVPGANPLLPTDSALRANDELPSDNIDLRNPTLGTIPDPFSLSLELPDAPLLPDEPTSASLLPQFQTSAPFSSAIPGSARFMPPISGSEALAAALTTSMPSSSALAPPPITRLNNPMFDSLVPNAFAPPLQNPSINHLANAAPIGLNASRAPAQVDAGILSRLPPAGDNSFDLGLPGLAGLPNDIALEGGVEVDPAWSQNLLDATAGIENPAEVPAPAPTSIPITAAVPGALSIPTTGTVSGAFSIPATTPAPAPIPTPAAAPAPAPEVQVFQPPFNHLVQPGVGVLPAPSDTQPTVPYSVLKAAVNATLTASPAVPDPQPDIIALLEQITKEERAKAALGKSNTRATTVSDVLNIRAGSSKAGVRKPSAKGGKRRRDLPVLPSEYVRSTSALLEQKNEPPKPTLPSHFAKKRRTNAGATQKVRTPRGPAGAASGKRRQPEGGAEDEAPGAKRQKTDAMTAEERRRVRAERNRVSAMKSRERLNQKEMELERSVYDGRVENRALKRGVIKYRRFLQQAIATIEQKYSREQAKQVCPKTYANLAHVDKTISECVWTFRPEDTPLIELKYKGAPKE